jgi:hypothetical protein
MLKQTFSLIAGLAVSELVIASTISFNENLSAADIAAGNGYLDYSWENVYLYTNTDELIRANEVSSTPSGNQSLGSKLTYSNFALNSAGDSTTVTLRTGQSGATFVHGEEEPGTDPGGWYKDFISVGDMDNYENDNFYIEFSTQNVFGASFSVFENGNRAGEKIRVRLWDGTEATIGTTDMYEQLNSGDDSHWIIDSYTVDALGSGIRQIFFDEDSGGDDIGVIGFGATVMTELTPSPVPIPAAAWLFGSALLGLVGIKRRKA